MTAILTQVQTQIKTDLLTLTTDGDPTTALLHRVYWGKKTNETAYPYAECYFEITNETRPDAARYIDTDCVLEVWVNGQSQESVQFALQAINKLWLTDSGREALRLLGVIFINPRRRALPLPMNSSNVKYNGVAEFDLTVRDTYS